MAEISITAASLESEEFFSDDSYDLLFDVKQEESSFGTSWPVRTPAFSKTSNNVGCRSFPLVSDVVDAFEVFLFFFMPLGEVASCVFLCSIFFSMCTIW